ncbi:MAG: HAD hydrolase-like protein [Solirubrobacteraceae bacterium]
MTPAQALLLDLDGCVLDSLPAIARCWAETLAEFGFEAPRPEQIRPYVGPPVDDAARALVPGADEPTIEAMVADYRRRSAQATDVLPFPGVVELLSELSDRGVRLGVATSKSIEVAEPQLDHLGLRSWFEFLEGTRIDELGTDKATIVARALGRLAPTRPAALVGDREQDVRGAHANAIPAIGALWGYGSREELVAAGADELARTPPDVALLIAR